MKDPLRLGLLAALVAFAVWLGLFLFPSPEKVIRKNLEHLAGSASFSSNEGMLVRLARAQKLGDYFSTNVNITLDIPGHGGERMMDREDIIQAAVAARSQIKTLEVEFPNIAVVVSPDKQSASAEVTLQARTSGGQDTILQEMNCTLRKINGQWLITRIKTVPRLLVSFSKADLLIHNRPVLDCTR